MNTSTILEIPPKLASQVEQFADEIGGLSFEQAARVLILLGSRFALAAPPVSLAEQID